MSAPALTVQLVVHNMAPWLPAALNSLRAQTRRDFEIVAVDDRSTDGTAEILRRETELPLRYIRAPAMSLAGIRNLAVEAARAPVVATLDGDDAWLPWYVERVLARFEGDPSVGIVSVESFLALEERLTTERYYADGGALRWFEDDQLLNVLHMNFIAPNHAVRRRLFDAVGGYASDLEACEDHDLWIRGLAAGFGAAYEPLPCAVYRLRGNSTVASRTRLVQGRVRVLERAATSLPGPAADVAAAELENQYRQLAIAEGKEALRTGDHRRARQCFRRVVVAPGATARERAVSLVVAMQPTIGRRVLDRRAAAPPPATATEARKARE